MIVNVKMPTKGGTIRVLSSKDKIKTFQSRQSSKDGDLNCSFHLMSRLFKKNMNCFDFGLR